MATTIAAAEFKAKCLKLLDEVAGRRETLAITKYGKPVAQLAPMPPERFRCRHRVLQVCLHLREDHGADAHALV